MLKTRLIFLICLLYLSAHAFPQTILNFPIIPTNVAQNLTASPLMLCRTITLSNQDLDRFIASDNVSFFIPSKNGQIKSLNPINSEVNWQTDLGGEIVSPPYLFGDLLVAVSKSFSKNETQNTDGVEMEKVIIRLIDKKSGIVKWRTIVEIESEAEIFPYGFGDVLLIANNMGKFYLLNKADGKIIATKILRYSLSTAPFFDGERIFFATIDKKIIEISARTFEEIRIVQVADIPVFIFFSGENLIWSNQSGKTICLKLESQEITDMRKISYKQKWFLRFGGKISSITLFQKNIIIASLDNYIYSVSVESGGIIWKQRLPGRPNFQLLFTESFFVVTTIGDPTAFLIAAQSGRTVNKINTGSENFFVGNPRKVFSSLSLLTNQGIFFYAPESYCNQQKN